MEIVGFSIDGPSSRGGLGGELLWDRIAVLVGPNGSGKTRILEAVVSSASGVFGAGRTGPYRTYRDHAALAWLYVDLLVPEDSEWLLDVARMMGQPGGTFERPPGKTGGFAKWVLPGPPFLPGPSDTFDDWAARVAEHAAGVDDPDGARWLEDALRYPTVDASTIPDGEVTLGIRPSRLPLPLRDQAAKLIAEDESRPLAGLLLESSHGSSSFVRVLELGEFPPAEADLRRLPVSATLITTEARSVDRVAEDAVAAVLAARHGGTPAEWLEHRTPNLGGDRRRDPWIEERADVLDVHAGVEEALVELSEAANELVPDFVSREGRLHLGVHDLPYWDGALPRVAVSLLPATGGEAISADLLGAGSRRWAAIAIELAGQLSASTSAATPVIAIDEPELHLHPLALGDIADWCEQRADSGHKILLATHATELLGRMLGAANVGVLQPEPSGVQLVEVTDKALRTIQDGAPTLGFPASSWLHLTRAVLVVEGEHDRALLEHFYGRQLESRGIRLLALRGTKNTKRFIDSEFLGAAGLPLKVLFDNTRAAALEAADAPEDVTDEERELRQLVYQLRVDGHDVRAYPFEAPDIMAALPETAVRAAFPDAKFTGWSDLVDAWREEPSRRNFKAYALERMGLRQVGADRFVATVLAHCPSAAIPGAGLHGTMAAVSTD